MPVTPEDRPLEALREETIDRLVVNYGHGTLSLDAFERRLDQALDAREHDALTALTRDLDFEADAGYLEQKRDALGTRYAQHDEDVEYIVHIFGGGDRSGRWTVPREIRSVTVFGGGDIDLTDAQFTSHTTRIRLFCLFGGVDILVPDHVNTIVKAFCIFGGVDNKAPSHPDPAAPRIVVEGLVLFGGVDVKVRKTFRERLVEFAGAMRAMFGQTNPSRRE
jgi:hypothetical protein